MHFVPLYTHIMLNLTAYAQNIFHKIFCVIKFSDTGKHSTLSLRFSSMCVMRGGTRISDTKISVVFSPCKTLYSIGLDVHYMWRSVSSASTTPPKKWTSEIVQILKNYIVSVNKGCRRFSILDLSERELFWYKIFFLMPILRSNGLGPSSGSSKNTGLKDPFNNKLINLF